MPILHHSFTVPFPGFVDIQFDGMEPMRFSEQSLQLAIATVQARRETFENEAAYQSILRIYEQALRLLKEEKK